MKRGTSSTTRLMAWGLLAVGDRVQKIEKSTPLSPTVYDRLNPRCLEETVKKEGTVVERYFSPGGLPEILVLWDGHRVCVPESANCLTVTTNIISVTAEVAA